MTRYDLLGEGESYIGEFEDGDYVLYTDHASEIAKAEARVKELEVERWNLVVDAAAEMGRANKAEARAERYRRALKVYADEKFYFPRSIILLAQREGVRLARVYSDFGDTAREALGEDA